MAKTRSFVFPITLWIWFFAGHLKSGPRKRLRLWSYRKEQSSPLHARPNSGRYCDHFIHNGYLFLPVFSIYRFFNFFISNLIIYLCFFWVKLKSFFSFFAQKVQLFLSVVCFLICFPILYNQLHIIIFLC